ncbi:MAG TPA: FG-GAP-like repeat-containing protein [Crinalium sp.]
MAENLYILGDQPSFTDATSVSTEFTVDATWVSQDRYPRQAADINGDGRADFVGFAQDAVYVSLSNSDGTFTNPVAGLSNNFTPEDGGWSSQNRYPRQLADVNGDGRADIIGFGQNAVYVSLSNGNGTFANAIAGLTTEFTVDTTWGSQDRYPRQVADVNGDGRADLVGFAQDGVYVSLSRGDGTFTNATVGLSNGFTPEDGGWSSQNQYPRQLADVNGDGRADIVGFGQNAVYVSLSNGDGTFANAIAGLTTEFTTDTTWVSQDRYPRQVADVNSDGRADLIGFAQDGVYVALSKGDGTFANATPGLLNGFTPDDGGWSSQNRYPRQLADINGDGQADIVGFGQNGVYVSRSTSGKNDSLRGGDGNDTLLGLTGDDLLYGQLGDDTLNGGTGHDYLEGGDGNDILMGLTGNDTLDGGLGTDQMQGGSGNDRYSVDNIADVVTELALDGTDTVISTISYTLGANVENLVLANAAVPINGTGNGLDNYITGNTANNTLSGQAGNDYLYGRQGNDTLFGDDGNDYLNGYGFSDVEKDSLTGGAGSDTFVLAEKIVEQNNLSYAFYTKAGKNDYALIKTWDPKGPEFDVTFDRLQLAGDRSQYKLKFSRMSGIGNSAKDTEILTKLGSKWERIGIIEDSTDVKLSRDAVFI